MLLTQDRERVRLLTFNRPDRANAFNEELYHAAADALRAAAADDDVAVVVFTGAGKAFCAGTDLLEMAETVDAGVGGDAVSRNGFPAFVDVLQEFPKPLLAAVNGAAVGLGFTMLAHCDIVLSGHLELSLPDQAPVVLGPGEAVVQRGTHHRWRPVGDEAVEWAALMLAVG